MRMGLLFSVAVWTAAALIITGLTGCGVVRANGLQFDSSFAVSAVQERSQVTRAYVKPAKTPLICEAWDFSFCHPQAPEVAGS